jgi:hypothetical protein
MVISDSQTIEILIQPLTVQETSVGMQLLLQLMIPINVLYIESTVKTRLIL